MSHHIVLFRGLTYSYPDGTQALDDVSFRIEHGESVALVGGNGAGKSTLLLHLNGSLFATNGTVEVGELPVTPLNAAMVRRAVGMVFQHPDDQLFMSTVLDDVAFGPLNMGLTEKAAADRAREALAQVEALALADRPPWRLSMGQKRRVAIAGVLAMTPDILVLDEPSAGLDPSARRRVLALLFSFSHTKIIATHDLDLALELCPRTIVLRDGRVLADGPSGQIFTDDPLLAAAGLERPPGLRSCPACVARAKARMVVVP